MEQAKRIRPGDTIIHPTTGDHVMVRTTTWTGHTVTLTFYGKWHPPFAVSKTTRITRIDKE